MLGILTDKEPADVFDGVILVIFTAFNRSCRLRSLRR